MLEALSFCKQKEKRLPEEALFLKFQRWIVCGLEADGSPCNATDIGAADAEVRKLAVGHAAELVDGFAVLAPGVELLCDVHDDVPFKALASSPSALTSIS